MSATYQIAEDPQGLTLVPAGDWTVLTLGDVAERLQADAHRSGPLDRLDLTDLGLLDTSGTFLILSMMKDGHTSADDAGHEEFRRLADLVRPALEKRAPAARSDNPLLRLFERIGRAEDSAAREAWRTMVFSGEMVVALGRTIRHPSRLRLVPLFAVMEQAGIDAIPIVMTMTFFIGAIIALVGTNILVTMGVSVYTVELVGVAILREFGVVIAAILLAGRSASAFAAEIGSMRMNQETDAMQVMGVDRFDALVVPRILAALLMLPLMTFCADMGGLFGGLLVSWATLDINPVFFLRRTLEDVSITQFWIGMAKAPFLAITIAASGCRNGLSVGGDVTSLGRRVTSAVVQSIFLIIMFDAIFAVLFRLLEL
ncbi:MlaE family ABC transporter permease [Sphingomonas oryzagri]